MDERLPPVVSAATRRSYERLTAVQPVMGRIAPLKDFLTSLTDRTLFHAGPPFRDLASIPVAVINSAAAMAVFEGWADNREDARAAVGRGDIVLKPAQDTGLVTPLAFVAGPNVFCLEVRDANTPESRMLSPLNDGPPPHGLRFGTGSADGLRLLCTLSETVGPDLARTARQGLPLLPLLAGALSAGDDLHGHVAALQSRVFEIFGDDGSAETRTFIEAAGQFVLNLVMATAALMIAAGGEEPESSMVVAFGGNGVEVGYKVAHAPDTWRTMPAHRPIGPIFPAAVRSLPMRAVGDSAVIEALGFGAACLRFSPSLQDALRDHIDPGFISESAHSGYIGPHPRLPLPGLRVGIDAASAPLLRGIMLGMVDESGCCGLIGRGVAPWG